MTWTVRSVKHCVQLFALAPRTGLYLGWASVGNPENQSPFQALLQRAVAIADGKKAAAAQAIGITPSRFSKILHATPGSYTLNAQNCFRLAALLGEPPQVVLRIVGKDDLADAIEEYYGLSAPRPAPVDVLADPIVRDIAALLQGERPIPPGALEPVMTRLFQALSADRAVAQTHGRRRVRR